MRLLLTVEELLTDESFIDYCTNESSPHKNKWEKISHAHPDQQKNILEAKALLAVLSPGLSTREVNEEVAKLEQLLQHTTGQYETGAVVIDNHEWHFTGDKKRINRRRMMMAASLALLTVIGAGLFFLTTRSSPAPATKAIHYYTQLGERKEIVLPDGSHVLMNSGSHLIVDKDFGIHARPLLLDGEAFFKVAKDAAKPFVVKSGAFSTTALGTAFYVNGNNPDLNFQVSLLEGRVKLENALIASVTLEPGQVAAWKPANETFTKQAFDTLALKGWLSGTIELNKTPVKEAFGILSKWYGVAIEDKRRSQKNTLLNGVYVNQSLQDILKVICFTSACTYSVVENKIVIQ